MHTLRVIITLGALYISSPDVAICVVHKSCLGGFFDLWSRCDIKGVSN